MQTLRSRPVPWIGLGISLLLATPTSGYQKTRDEIPAWSNGSIAEIAMAALERGTNNDRYSDDYGNDPIEQIYWQTRDVDVGQAEEAPGPFAKTQVALAAEDLDEIRGGFEFGDASFKVSFGIERAVFVNGQLATSTVLNFKDLQWSASSGMPRDALAVFRNGAGNTISARIGPDVAGTIIQNTLNDQRIQNITTINATVNSGQLMRSMAVQSAIHDAVVNSLRR